MHVGDVFIDVPVTMAQFVFPVTIVIYEGNFILIFPVEDKPSFIVTVNVYYVLELK